MLRQFIVADNNNADLGKGKGKAVPLEAWSGPEGFQEVKVPRFHYNGTGWW